MHHSERHNDFMLELPDPRGFWRVREAGSKTVLGEYNSKREALAAIRRLVRR